MLYFLRAIGMSFNIKGRDNRKEYWYFVLFYLLFSFFIIPLIANLLKYDINQKEFLQVLYFLLTLPAFFSATVRRLHDRNKSGVFLFIIFFPFVGIILVLIQLAKSSAKEENQWGQPADEDPSKDISLKKFFNKKCPYCGGSLPFYKNYHTECKIQYQKSQEELQKAKNEIQLILDLSYKNNVPPLKVVNQIAQKALEYKIKDSDLREIFLEYLRNYVELVLEDGVITEEEELRVKEYLDAFHIDNKTVNEDPLLLRFIKGVVLREILNGNIPDFKKQVDVPINFTKDEKIVWVFKNVEYWEYRTYKEYEGASPGISIRIARGVYYRASAFKGYPVEKNKLVYLDTGALIITDHYIYFYGSLKSFRIPYKKMLSFKEYSDGIGIFLDQKNAKPIFFRVDDVWFIYNLVINFCKID